MSRPTLRQLRDRLARIQLVATDVDGVLTDGSLYYAGDGEELKTFHVRDGLGLQLLMEAGVEVVVLSGRESAALRHRLAELHVRHVHVACRDKRAALAETLASLGIDAGSVAVIADDVLDLPMMAQAGVAVAVRDAHPRVLAAAHAVTDASGGRGALRELADAIVDAREAGRASTDFHVVIPSRFAATRLPGKPLRLIAGRPMIEHVWRRGIESGAQDVLVACDDERIVAAVQAVGGRALLTSPHHPSGTDRVAEVAAREGWSDQAIVVNLQGDEPCMPGSAVRLVADALCANPDAGIATLATPVLDAKSLFDPNVVKLVRDERGFARWFSRAPIPWVRGAFDNGVPARLPEGVPFLRHLGLYAYRVEALRALCSAPVHPLERAESLEQLRALSSGVAIVCPVLAVAPSPGVDSEADLARVQAEVEKLEGARVGARDG